MPHLFCFGLGYSALVLANRLSARGWKVSGTTRSGEGVAGTHRVWLFDGTSAVPPAAFAGVTHLLSSVPPDSEGDPVLLRHARGLAARAGQFDWVGYLSTTGVYGDRGGEWVDEDSPLAPSTERGHRRLSAENAWLDLFRQSGLPIHIFRLAGIYGPGRNQLLSLLEGKARAIIKPGQVFSRIHVDDLAGVLEASITKPDAGRAYNVCDDEPAPPQDVLRYAAKLLGMEPPLTVNFDGAALSPMARSFYSESKRVSNRRIKRELGYDLAYPNYREGLEALLASIPSNLRLSKPRPP
jgi:nucleoside-diphosphate-sugar epimerase